MRSLSTVRPSVRPFACLFARGSSHFRRVHSFTGNSLFTRARARARFAWVRLNAHRGSREYRKRNVRSRTLAFSRARRKQPRSPPLCAVLLLIFIVVIKPMSLPTPSPRPAIPRTSRASFLIFEAMDRACLLARANSATAGSRHLRRNFTSTSWLRVPRGNLTARSIVIATFVYLALYAAKWIPVILHYHNLRSGGTLISSNDRVPNVTGPTCNYL